jgi:hypothetical protein
MLTFLASLLGMGLCICAVITSSDVKGMIECKLLRVVGWSLLQLPRPSNACDEVDASIDDVQAAFTPGSEMSNKP